MSLYEKVAGTISALFQLGLGGPGLKNNGGEIDAVASDGATLVNVRAAGPNGANDVLTRSSLVAGTNITLTPSAGELTIDSSGGTLHQQVFDASGDFVVPTGVNSIFVEGCGGAGGGAGGKDGNLSNFGAGGSGGGAATWNPAVAQATTPGGTITVTVGAGGAGGARNTNGGEGANSILDGLDFAFHVEFEGASGGVAQAVLNDGFVPFGGCAFLDNIGSKLAHDSRRVTTSSSSFPGPLPGQGGNGGAPSAVGDAGVPGLVSIGGNYVGGAGGPAHDGGGGGGGGGGPCASGGAGGAGASGGTPGAGGTAGGIGAGGGGGGGGGSFDGGAINAGPGGAGGHGRVIISWIA